MYQLRELTIKDPNVYSDSFLRAKFGGKQKVEDSDRLVQLQNKLQDSQKMYDVSSEETRSDWIDRQVAKNLANGDPVDYKALNERSLKLFKESQ